MKKHVLTVVSTTAATLVGLLVVATPLRAQNVLVNGSFDDDAASITPVSGETYGQIFASLSSWTQTGSGNLYLADGDIAGPPFYAGDGNGIPFRYAADGDTYLLFDAANYTLTQSISVSGPGSYKASFDLIYLTFSGSGALTAQIEVFDGSDTNATELYDSGTINMRNQTQETWESYVSPLFSNTGTEMFIRITLVDTIAAGLGGIDNVSISPRPDIATPAALHFGTVAHNTTSNANLAVTNNGPVALTITGVTTSGTDAERFEVLDWPTTVDAGATSNIVVRYSAGDSLANHSATLHIASDDPYTPDPAVDLTAATSVGGIALIAHYPLGEDGSLDASNRPRDASANGYHFTGSAADTDIDAVVGGAPGTDSGSTAHVFFTGNSSYDGAWEPSGLADAVIGKDLIVEMWLRTTATGDIDIFESDGVNPGSLLFQPESVQAYGQGESGIISIPPPTNWTHVAAVIRRNGTADDTIDVYVNGDLQGIITVTANGGNISWTGGTSVGVRAGGGKNYTGDMDDLMVKSFEPDSNPVGSFNSEIPPPAGTIIIVR